MPIADNGDLHCDTCTNVFQGHENTLYVFESARVKGWHIYQNFQMQVSRSTGQSSVSVDTRILCPTCIGTHRSQLPAAPKVLEGQADILEDLGIEIKPVEKGKGPKRAVN